MSKLKAKFIRWILREIARVYYKESVKDRVREKRTFLHAPPYNEGFSRFLSKIAKEDDKE